MDAHSYSPAAGDFIGDFFFFALLSQKEKKRKKKKKKRKEKKTDKYQRDAEGGEEVIPLEYTLQESTVEAQELYSRGEVVF